jgi:hypothetical protein
MDRRIIFSHYDGLGDYFVCNGLVNYLSEFVDELHLPIPSCWQETLSDLYSTNSKVILFHSSPSPESKELLKYAKENEINYIHRKVWDNQHNRPSFQTDLYKWCNIDYSVRYSHFVLPRSERQIKFYIAHIKEEKYALVHDTCSRGRLKIDVITSLPKFYLNYGLTNNLLDYAEIIKRATEIHVVDSSVYHIIDNMNINAELFFHDIRNNVGSRITVSDKWNKIFYPYEIFA